MNDWDSIVLDIESIAYENGKVDGINDAINDNDNTYIAGKRLGYFKGYAISMEMTYYKVMILNLIDNNNVININDRERKRCDKILEKVNSFPKDNDNDFDFDTKLNEVRSLYRSLGSLVIPFDFTSPNDNNKKGGTSMDW